MHKQKDMTTILILLGIGLVAGMVSGFIGLGGGVIIVPALVYFIGMSQHMSQGTSLAMMIPPIGILGVMNYYKGGMVDIKAALILASAFIIGSFFGSKAAMAMPEETIKKFFGFALMLIALKMVFGK